MGLFTSKPPQEINFKIYTNEYLKLKKPTEEEAEEETVFKFTALGEFAFKNKSNVPYEVLEAGDFSSDSIQATPFTIQIRAIYTPIMRKASSGPSMRCKLPPIQFPKKSCCSLVKAFLGPSLISTKNV